MGIERNKYYQIDLENIHKIINYDKKYSVDKKDINMSFLEKNYYTLYEVSEFFSCNARSLRDRIENVGVNIIIVKKYKYSKDKRYFFRREQIDNIYEKYIKSIKVTEAYDRFKQIYGEVIRKESFLGRFKSYKIPMINISLNFIKKADLIEYLDYVNKEKAVVKIPVKFKELELRNDEISILDLSKNYYTFEQTRKMFNISKSVLSRISTNTKRNYGIDILKINNRYFFKKRDVDIQYTLFKDSVSFEKILNEIYEIEGKIFSRTSLYKKVEVKKIPILRESVFISKSDGEKLKKLCSKIKKLKDKNTDYEYFIKNANLENNGIFKVSESNKFQKEKISMEEMEEKYYSMNYVSNILNIERKLIPDRCKKNKNIEYIRLFDCRYFFEKKYLKKQINQYNNSATIKEAFAFYNLKCPNTLTIGAFIQKFEIYHIDLFATINYVKKADVEKFTNDVSSFLKKKCRSIKQLQSEIEQSIFEYKYAECFSEKLNKIIKILEIEVYEGENRANVYGKKMIPEYECKRVLEYIEKEIFFIIKSGHDEELTISKIRKYMKKNLFYNYIEARKLIELAGGKIYDKNECAKKLENKKIRSFKLKNTVNEIFLLKEDLHAIIKKIENSIYVRDVIENIELGLNKKIDFHITGEYLESRGIRSYNVTFLKYKCINREVASNLYSKMKYEEEFKECKTEYEKFRTRIKYYPIKNNIPETLKIFDGYCMKKSNKIKSTTINRTLYQIYTILCNTIKNEIEKMSEEELGRTYKKLIWIANEKKISVREMIIFLNFLKKEYNLVGTIDFSLRTENDEYEPYGKKEFFELFLEINNILLNDDILKLMIKDRVLSSSVLYVYLHYFLAWRKGDILKSFPMINLKFVGGWKNPEKFIKWIDDGNIFTEEMGRKVCNYIEENIKNRNLKISKTNEKLICIFPQIVVKELGMLICINEANRLMCEKQKITNAKIGTAISVSGSTSKRIGEIFKLKLGIDIKKILGSNFSNPRANKSFLINISDKAEEFGVAIGYYYAQKFRNHKTNKNVLAETTKIYLKKDISEASVIAFISQTMGCIKYLLLDLIDEKFKSKSRIEKLENISEISMTNLEIEKMLKEISLRSKFINEELKEIIRGREKLFIKELLYGNHYGKHDEIKCLFKVIKQVNEENFIIKGIENKDCKFRKVNCIGCKYMIATKYFIYEFSEIFNRLLDKILETKNKHEKEIYIEILILQYIPIVLEIQDIYGKEKIKKIFDINKFNRIRNLNN